MATFDNVSAPGWPPTPLAATAIVGSGIQVNLTWNALTNATSYNIKRSTTSGGPYTTIATGVTTTNYTDMGVLVSAGCYYVVSAMVGGNETANGPEAALTFPQLTGGIIGTAGSWGGSGSTIINVFDNNLTTYFDGPDANGDWVGLDFGAGVSNVITQINYCPRAGFESRMTNGVFQGANRPDFSDAVTLFTVTTQPATGVFSTATINNPSAFRYVRYLSPAGGFCNVAELQIYGCLFAVLPPAAPAGLAAAAVSTSQINLCWNAVAGALYDVQRATTDGGPYILLASNVTTTSYPDSGLAGGTMYYYVVSAVNSGGASSNSAQAAAATFSPALGSLVHRYSFSESNGATVADSVGGPVWNGTLPNGGTFIGGQLILSAALSQSVTLPPGIVGSLSNFTIMAWVNLASTSNWSRIFDFGDNITTNMFLTTQSGDGTVRFAITTDGGAGQQQINGNTALSPGVLHQVTVTLSGATGILYVDGAAVGTNSGMTLNPAILGSTVTNYLGKSQYPPDPDLDGAMDEFRIHNAALSAAEVAATSALGPGQMSSTNSPQMGLALAGTNLTLAWPVANADFTLQACTNLALGNWQIVTPLGSQQVGGQWQVTLPQTTNDSTFYRLVK